MTRCSAKFCLKSIHRIHELFGFNYRMAKCPNTNNLIESFNSHIQGRLKSIKGFEKYHVSATMAECVDDTKKDKAIY